MRRSVTHQQVAPSAHLLEGERGLVPVLVPEVIVHAEVRLPAELVAGLAVWDALDDAALRPDREREEVTGGHRRLLRSVSGAGNM